MGKTHSQKARIARRMRTATEERLKVPIFSTAGWNKRKSARFVKEVLRCKNKNLESTAYQNAKANL